MELRIIFTLLAVAIWLYLLHVCKKGNLAFFHFIIGSVGLFIIAMFQVDLVQQAVISLFVRLLAPIGTWTGMFQSFPQIGAFFLDHGDTAMSFTIDLECSGIIEMLVFVCLVLFFQVYSKREKIWVSLVGGGCIILFNAIRMLTILTIIYYGGGAYYIVAHSIVGRVVFYGLTILLYYVVFTKKQIKEQKVGEFAYESSVLDQ